MREFSRRWIFRDQKEATRIGILYDAHYEPRGFHGIGLGFGTSNRGACHNVGGWTIRDELITKEYDRFATKGKGRLVQTLQDNRAYIDSLGICTVVRGPLDLPTTQREIF
jgi:aldehyde:ferredoxin oxidoreductase